MDLSWLGIRTNSPAQSPRKGAGPAALAEDDDDSDNDEVVPRGLKSAKEHHISENELVKYWLGTWKRTLEWREFGGGYGHLRETNTVVQIDEVQRFEAEIGVRHIRWSFGKSLQRGELRSGYVMKCTCVSRSNEMNLEWQYSGSLCTGRFMANVGLVVLNFWTKTACITVMYRILDSDSMAVTIVEVDDKKESSLQYGNMYRIDPAAYAHVM